MEKFLQRYDFSSIFFKKNCTIRFCEKIFSKIQSSNNHHIFKELHILLSIKNNKYLSFFNKWAIISEKIVIFATVFTEKK